ncbi:MAG: hypothetical protein K6U80_13200 [Firmicutes bacterium]|nr:hypothetical protein [Bacillota bacterium]
MFSGKAKGLFIMLVLAINFGCVSQAGTSIFQDVTFSVQAINEIAVNGPPRIKEIVTVIEGSRPVKMICAVSSYSISTNETNKKITGFLKRDLPADTNLVICLEAPANATSVGNVALTTMPSDLVIGVGKVAEKGKLITFKFKAPVSGQNLMFSEIVVLTITD